MSAERFVYHGARAGVPDIGISFDHVAFPLAEIIEARSTIYGRAEFIFLRGAVGIQRGSVVEYELDSVDAKLAGADATGNIAVALSQMNSSEFGFFQIWGRAIVKVAPDFVADRRCFLTTTPGTVDDSDAEGPPIIGMRSSSGYVDGFAEVQLTRPFVNEDA